MRSFVAITRKELATLWLSPLPYVVGALLHLVVGTLYVEQLDVRGQALYQPLFPIAGFLLIALVPILAMRTFAEEYRTGSLDLLLAIPVPATRLVIGKWLATVLTTLVALAPVGVVLGLVALWGDPDSGPLLSGLLGLALLAAALGGIGVAASSVTSSQPVAALLAFFVGLLLWFSHVGSESWAAGGVLAHFSLSERLRSFSGGVIDSVDAGLLVLLTAAALIAAAIPLARRASRRSSGGVATYTGGGPEPFIRFLRGARPVVLLAVALVVLALGDRALAATRVQWDLTVESSLTLSDETRDVVSRIDKPVRVTAFIERTSPLRAQAAALLDRYRDLNRRIAFRLVDPSRAPAEAARLGLDPALGGLVVQADGRSQTASIASEQDITSAIARVLRAESPGVCFTQGHGEPDPAGTLDFQLGGASGSLVANGYRVRAVNLVADATIPDGCEALVLANPTAALRPAAVAAIGEYLSGGGRAIVMADNSPVDFDQLVGPYGLGVEFGVVVEGDPDSRLGDDVLSLIVQEFRSSNPSIRRLPPLLFAGALGVTAEEDSAAGISAQALATSSATSFLKRRPAEGAPGGDGFDSSFDAAADLPGPVPVIAASDASGRVDGEVVRTRIVLVGDVDWATNSLLGEGGNSRFFIQALDWLTLDEDLVSVTTNLAAFRPLELTSQRLTYARLVTSGAVPAFFILAGLTVWALRRRL